MSGDSGAPKGFAAELRRRPAKAAFFGLVLLAALWIWASVLFGGEDQPQNVLVDYNKELAAAPRGAAVLATESLGPIESFDAAMARLTAWKEPLQGWLEGHGKDLEVYEPSAETLVGLELTGTAVFGRSRYALFRGRRVKEGDRLGRYVVVAIRPREVDLNDGRRVLTVRIADGHGQPAPAGTPAPR